MGFDATAWQQAAAGANEEAPPDAEYDVELIDTKIATRERDGAQWVVLRWHVLSGRERDTEWESMHTIDGYKPDGEANPGLPFTIQSLAMMGVGVNDLNTTADLRAAVEALEGGAFAVQVKRSGSFTNTYPQRALAAVAASLPGTGSYEPPAPTSSNAIYGADPPPITHQTTPAEVSGKAPLERTGESDVTPAGATAEFKPESAGDESDLPWNQRQEPPPQKGDPGDSGDPMLY